MGNSCKDEGKYLKRNWLTFRMQNFISSWHLGMPLCSLPQCTLWWSPYPVRLCWAPQGGEAPPHPHGIWGTPWWLLSQGAELRSRVQSMQSESESVSSLIMSLCNPMDCSPPGSSVKGTSQPRILEWVAISFSRRSSWLRDWTWSPAMQAES